ncbi:nucleoid DNA-binding protein [Bradyrhizobium ottawaense]
MTTATEIADEIAKAYNLPKAQAKAIVDGVFKSIADAAASDAETNVPGFGKFKVKHTRGTRRPQSLDWRDDQDRGGEEADVRPGQGPQGCAERLKAGAQAGPLVRGFSMRDGPCLDVEGERADRTGQLVVAGLPEDADGRHGVLHDLCFRARTIGAKAAVSAGSMMKAWCQSGCLERPHRPTDISRASSGVWLVRLRPFR